MADDQQLLSSSDNRNARAMPPASLAERLDPAIGEATSGISMLLTELVRRTFRGGVQKVDEELQGVVAEKVDSTIALRLPAIEAAAHQTALTIAREIVTERVGVLERETKETAEQLLATVSQVETKSADQTRELAERLASELSRTGLEVDTKTRELADRLTSELSRTGEEVASKTRQIEERLVADLTRTDEKVETKTREITERLAADISHTQKQAQELLTTGLTELEQRSATQTKTLLESEITEAERRAEAKARELMLAEVEALKQKSKGPVEAMREQITRLQQWGAELQQQLADEAQAREADTTAVRSEAAALRHEWTNSLGETRKATSERLTDLKQLVDRHAQQQTALLEQRVQELSEQNAALAERLARLEEPKGLKALWQRMFGKKKPPTVGSDDASDENDE